MSAPLPQRGFLAEFGSAEALLAALAAVRAHGYRELEVFSPYELPRAEALLDLPRPRLPIGVLICGLLGAAGAYLVQWYANAVSFPINVGGRPLHPAPAFVPITFELGVLSAAFAAFIGFFVCSHLLRLWRPEFEVEGFERVSVDRFWLAVDARDPRFAAARTREELAALQPLRVVGLGGIA
jgi:Alternative complex III, ActD subunit